MFATALVLAALQTPAPPHRYRLEVRTVSELDQTSIGKGKLADGLVTVASITVAMADTTGGQTVRVTVDSIALDPSGSIAAQLRQHPTAAQDARGAAISVYVVRGKIKGPPILSDSTNPALVAVVQAVGVLFPGVRTGAKVGDSWADTSRINNASGSRRQSGEVVATWKVIGVEGDALVLEGTSQSRTRTEDSNNGQTITLTGNSTERVVIPPTGPVLRATIATSNEISIAVPSLQSPLPGKTTGSLTLTPIP